MTERKRQSSAGNVAHYVWLRHGALFLMFARQADLRGTMLFGRARLHSGSLGRANSCLVWCLSHIWKAAVLGCVMVRPEFTQKLKQPVMLVEGWSPNILEINAAHLLAYKDHAKPNNTGGTNWETVKSFQNPWSFISEKMFFTVFTVELLLKSWVHMENTGHSILFLGWLVSTVKK